MDAKDRKVFRQAERRLRRTFGEDASVEKIVFGDISKYNPDNKDRVGEVLKHAKIYVKTANRYGGSEIRVWEGTGKISAGNAYILEKAARKYNRGAERLKKKDKAEYDRIFGSRGARQKSLGMLVEVYDVDRISNSWGISVKDKAREKYANFRKNIYKSIRTGLSDSKVPPDVVDDFIAALDKYIRKNFKETNSLYTRLEATIGKKGIDDFLNNLFASDGVGLANSLGEFLRAIGFGIDKTTGKFDKDLVFGGTYEEMNIDDILTRIMESD